METVELIVILGVAVMLAGIVGVFIANWEVGDQSESLLDILFSRGTEQGFTTVDLDGLVRELHTFWTRCAMNATNTTLTLYVEGEGPLNHTRIFSRVRSLAWCDTLQSRDHRCGVREDVEILANITLPRVVRIACHNETLILS